MQNQEIQKLVDLSRKRGKVFRVLIVDDEQWVRDVFKDYCELTDVLSVEMAASGDEAIRKLGSADYDLVTLDIIMPELSGLDTLATVKRVSPRVPIMIVTGNATDRLVNEAGVMGACQVMYKPVKLDEFISGITAALSR